MFVGYRGGLLNSVDISRVERSDRGGTTIYMRDGTAHFSDEDYDDLSLRLGPVISETNGTRAVTMGYFGGEFYHSTQPILGWTITASGPEAIIVDGGQAQFILFADGTVEQPHLASFDSLDDAIEDYKRQHPPKGR